MPELRYNLATKEWVIIATERAKRPEDFASKSVAPSSESVASCPFCPGREGKTPPEIYALGPAGRQPNTGGWQVRVIPNAFPALSLEGELTRKKTPEGFLKMDGVGVHEVIIESPDHEAVIATLPLEQVEKIFSVYRTRYQALAQDPRFEAVILFKNHGRGAGTSLHHPHSQIVAVPVTPQNTRDRINTAMAHFDESGSCLYCDLVKMERQSGTRIILENEKFVVFSPFASRLPFEIWVLPKQHCANFEKTTEDDCRALAGTMKTILGKLYRSLHNPDFNYAFFSASSRVDNIEFFHWHVKIFPRITNQAGFEIGSGMMINTVVPETAAQYLKTA